MQWTFLRKNRKNNIWNENGERNLKSMYRIEILINGKMKRFIVNYIS